MAKLSKKQIEYLEEQGISLDMMFDATGYTRSEYKSVMKVLDKKFAYGVTPCQKYGHTIRNSSGTCIQCFPASIQYTLLHNSKSNLYICGSIEGQILKIGISNYLDLRVNSLNEDTYAGYDDWILLASVEIENAGVIERSVHQELDEYRVVGFYEKDGEHRQSKECYKCNYTTAMEVLLSKIDDDDLENWIEYLFHFEVGNYEFED